MIAIITTVLFSCSFNVVFLEILLRGDPGCGNLITFCQFLTISIEGLIFTVKFGTKERIVPLKNYIFLVTMFFSVSVANNCALNFDISMPLHMIFKSGSLVANLILGIIILKRRYTWSKYVSVVLVTAGIATATLASQNLKKENAPVSTVGDFSVASSLIGIGLLTFALVVSAYMGIYQETLYAQFGKHPKEVLFYSHALPLPGFIFLYHDIFSHCVNFSKSETINLPMLRNVPGLWLYLLGNILTQYVCIRSVFTLSTLCSSLTVTMVITLRKFISLMFSIFYFQNVFTTTHWIGTFLVFIGTLLFTDVPQLIHRQLTQKKAGKTE